MTKTILVIEDDKSVVALLEDVLRSEGFNVLVERDGEWGLRTFQEKPVDLIIVDVLIPKIKGFDLITRLRETERGKELPIIVISGVYRAANHKERIVQKHGVVDYLDKPVDIDHLIDVLHDVFSSAYPVPEAATAPGPEPAEAPVVALPKKEAIPELPRLAVADRGSLESVPFARLLGNLFAARVTGQLLLKKGSVKKIVYLRQGIPVFVKSNLVTECLGQVMVAEKLISEDECRRSLEKKKVSGKRQGEVLVEMGSISPHNLEFALELQLQTKLYDMFSWMEGEYQFVPKDDFAGQAVALSLGPTAMIYEGASRTMSAERIERDLERIQELPVVPAKDPTFRYQALELDPRAERLLDRIDGQRSVKKLLESADFDIEDAALLVYALSCTGLLQVAGAMAEGPIVLSGDDIQMLSTNEINAAQELAKMPMAQRLFDEAPAGATNDGAAQLDARAFGSGEADGLVAPPIPGMPPALAGRVSQSSSPQGSAWLPASKSSQSSPPASQSSAWKSSPSASSPQASQSSASSPQASQSSSASPIAGQSSSSSPQASQSSSPQASQSSSSSPIAGQSSSSSIAASARSVAQTSPASSKSQPLFPPAPAPAPLPLRSSLPQPSTSQPGAPLLQAATQYSAMPQLSSLLSQRASTPDSQAASPSQSPQGPHVAQSMHSPLGAQSMQSSHVAQSSQSAQSSHAGQSAQSSHAQSAQSSHAMQSTQSSHAMQSAQGSHVAQSSHVQSAQSSHATQAPLSPLHGRWPEPVADDPPPPATPALSDELRRQVRARLEAEAAKMISQRPQPAAGPIPSSAPKKPPSAPKTPPKKEAPKLDLERDHARTKKELTDTLDRLTRADLYEALGVSRRASLEDIKLAHQKLTRDHHPDRVLAGSHSRELRTISERIMITLERAFETLSNPQSRKTYDRVLGIENGDARVAPLIAAERAFTRGKEALERNELATAREFFFEATEKCPQEGAYYAYLGLAMFLVSPRDENNKNVALEALDKAIELAPLNEEVYLFRATIQQKSGNRTEAIREYERALRCNPDSVPALEALKLLEPPQQRKTGFLSRLTSS